MDNIATGLAQW